MANKNTKIAIGLIIIIALVVISIVGYYFLVIPPKLPPKYTTGLTVGMHVVDSSTGVQFTTGGITFQQFASGANPLSYVSTAVYQKVGFYTTDIVLGSFWALSGMTAGSYSVLTYQPSAQTCYPALTPITVAGTNDVNLEVWATPNEVDMSERATSIITVAGYGYNSTAQTYSLPLSGSPSLILNTTKSPRFWLIYTITVTGINKQVLAGRYYITNVAGFTPTSYSFDGSTASSVPLQTDSTVDGQLGYYIPFSALLGGSVHRLDVYFTCPTPISTTTTLTLKQFEYETCPTANTVLRWWTDETSPVRLTLDGTP